MAQHVYGVDLGTSNIKMYSLANDVTLNEKNVIAIKNKNEIFKFGDFAFEMYEKAPGNINVTFPQNITGESLLYILDLSGIKVATGSACNSSSIEPSHVLKAIGLSNEDAMRTVRFTLSEDITYREIDKVIDEIDKAIKLIELN